MISCCYFFVRIIWLEFIYVEGCGMWNGFWLLICCVFNFFVVIDGGLF